MSALFGRGLRHLSTNVCRHACGHARRHGRHASRHALDHSCPTESRLESRLESRRFETSKSDPAATWHGIPAHKHPRCPRPMRNLDAAPTIDAGRAWASAQAAGMLTHAPRHSYRRAHRRSVQACAWPCGRHLPVGKPLTKIGSEEPPGMSLKYVLHMLSAMPRPN